jgi:hypothetical protein
MTQHTYGDGTLPSAVNPQPLQIRAVSLVPPGGTAPRFPVAQEKDPERCARGLKPGQMPGGALQKPARLATIYDTSVTVGLTSSRHSPHSAGDIEARATSASARRTLSWPPPASQRSRVTARLARRLLW